MNLAIVQPVPDAPAAQRAYRDEVAALGAALRGRGHTVSLVLVTPSDEAALVQTMAENRPEAVLMYVESLAADVAARAAGAVASALGAPLIPFGPHARLCPGECLSLAGAEAVAVGPADFTVPAYVETRGSSLDSSRTPGFWVKCETGVMQNPVPPPPASLADRPAPARDLYPPELALDAAGFAYVGVARGGEPPSAPSAAAPPMPGAAGWPLRHRPVAQVMEEILAVTEAQFDLGGWRIGNERWIASPQWLAEFAERYAREVGLPIRTTLYAPDVKDHAAGLLKRAGCEEAVIPVGSASNLIRNEILGMNVSAEDLVAAFQALRRAGVRSVARVEVGSPYETPVTLDETALLLQRLDPDRVEAVLHYPEPGSYAHKVAKENGWLVSDPAAAHLAAAPALVPPGLTAEEIATWCELLPYVVHRPRIVPLLRLARRVRIGKYGTVYDLVAKPFLVPPMRRSR